MSEIYSSTARADIADSKTPREAEANAFLRNLVRYEHPGDTLLRRRLKSLWNEFNRGIVNGYSIDDSAARPARPTRRQLVAYSEFQLEIDALDRQMWSLKAQKYALGNRAERLSARWASWVEDATAPVKI